MDVKRLSRQIGLKSLLELQQHLQTGIWVAVMLRVNKVQPSVSNL